jgi:type IV fimbrial biogenesis protein FimT
MIELLIAIGVISILTAVSLPGITTWRHNAHLKSAARDLYSNLQKAKLNAVKTNSEYAVVFNPAGNSYSLVNDSGDGDFSTKGDNTEEQTVYLNSYGSGVKYGQGSATTNATSGGGAFPADYVSHTDNLVIFRPNGMVTNQGYIYLSNDLNQICYAIGTPTISGVIVTKKASGASWQ